MAGLICIIAAGSWFCLSCLNSGHFLSIPMGSTRPLYLLPWIVRLRYVVTKVPNPNRQLSDPLFMAFWYRTSSVESSFLGNSFVLILSRAFPTCILIADNKLSMTLYLGPPLQRIGTSDFDGLLSPILLQILPVGTNWSNQRSVSMYLRTLLRKAYSAELAVPRNFVLLVAIGQMEIDTVKV